MSIPGKEGAILSPLIKPRACRFINRCPSATGWCNNRNPDNECVRLLLGIIERMKQDERDKSILPVKEMEEEA